MCISPIYKHITHDGVYRVTHLPHNASLVQRFKQYPKYNYDKFGDIHFHGRMTKISCSIVAASKMNEEGKFDYYVQLDCGKCAECIRKICSRWSWRLEKDMQNKVAYFVTLTYDNEHLPTDVVYYNEDETKSISLHDDKGLLCYRDLQLYHKRLRQFLSYWYDIDDVKFFACGEYGKESRQLPNGHLSSGHRPHFHELIWFTETSKCKGWCKKRDNRGRKQKFINICGNGGFYDVPKLTSTFFRTVSFRIWNKCDERNFNMSQVRSTRAVSKYITKYIIKQKYNEVPYNSNSQKLCPVLRRMSQGIAKNYMQSIADDIIQNRSFGVPVKTKQGESMFFYPSICLKWAYQKSFIKSDDDTYFNTESIGDKHKCVIYSYSDEWLQMLELRDKYIEEHPQEDVITQYANYIRLRQSQQVVSQSLIFDF